MKKIIAIVLALTLALSLAACGGAADSKTIKVGTAPGPHAEIMEAVAGLIEAEGYTLEVVEFSDYVLPNTALDEGEIDANYFQHITYMNSFNDEHGLKMVSAAGRGCKDRCSQRPLQRSPRSAAAGAGRPDQAGRRRRHSGYQG